MEAGGNNTKNPRCKAIDTVIAVYLNDKLLLPCHNFVQSRVAINGRLYDFYRDFEEVDYHQSHGRFKVCEGRKFCCCLIPSFSIGVDKYWFLNQVTYASEFLARKRFLQRA
jgi:hypothetical protein